MQQCYKTGRALIAPTTTSPAASLHRSLRMFRAPPAASLHLLPCMIRTLLPQLQTSPYLFPTTCTPTARLRGPSSSTSSTDCHVPMHSLPCSVAECEKGHSRDVGKACLDQGLSSNGRVWTRRLALNSDRVENRNVERRVDIGGEGDVLLVQMSKGGSGE
eukprot:358299-Chlamydomonas_euryale.AAC.14